MSLDSEWIKVSSLFKNTFLHKDIQSFWESVFEGIGNTEFGAFFAKKFLRRPVTQFSEPGGLKILLILKKFLKILVRC